LLLTKRMPALLDGITVVLVEDDLDARELLMAMMEQRGAVVVAASNATSALETLACIKPDVLVTDLSMPDRDGWWLMHEARTQGLLNGVAAVAVTAATLAPQQVRGAGFDAYLRKPIDPAVLCARIRTVARRSTRRSA
jgi:DNA-binding response OmpR family regulator